MLASEVGLKLMLLLAVTLPLVSVAAVVAWTSYTRLKLRSPGILFLAGLIISLGAVYLVATPGNLLATGYETLYQERLAVAFVLAAAGISNVAISLYLAHMHTKALKSGREPGPSLRSGLRHLRSQR